MAGLSLLALRTKGPKLDLDTSTRINSPRQSLEQRQDSPRSLASAQATSRTPQDLLPRIDDQSQVLGTSPLSLAREIGQAKVFQSSEISYKPISWRLLWDNPSLLDIYVFSQSV